MLYKEKMAELRQILERWNSHNEVHARPTDKMLYEFLSKLLNIGEDACKEPERTQVTFGNGEVAEVQGATNDDPPGGNNPGAPDIP